MSHDKESMVMTGLSEAKLQQFGGELLVPLPRACLSPYKALVSFQTCPEGTIRPGRWIRYSSSSIVPWRKTLLKSNWCTCQPFLAAMANNILTVTTLATEANESW